jgi:outer membrane lipoprotein-sorting protein
MFEKGFANIQNVKDVKKVGTGTILGFKCDIYQRTIKTKEGTVTAKVWLSTDKRLPTALKMTATGPKGTTTEETKKIKLNIDIPDSNFVLPKGTVVQEVKPGQMPGGKQQPKQEKK